MSISELRDLADEPAVLWWFLAAGLTISVAMVCIYYALDLGKVLVVIPIASTGPFFSVILAATFLRDVTEPICGSGRKGNAIRLGIKTIGIDDKVW